MGFRNLAVTVFIIFCTGTIQLTALPSGDTPETVTSSNLETFLATEAEKIDSAETLATFLEKVKTLEKRSELRISLDTALPKALKNCTWPFLTMRFLRSPELLKSPNITIYLEYAGAVSKRKAGEPRNSDFYQATSALMRLQAAEAERGVSAVAVRETLLHSFSHSLDLASKNAEIEIMDHHTKYEYERLKSLARVHQYEFLQQGFPLIPFVGGIAGASGFIFLSSPVPLSAKVGVLAGAALGTFALGKGLSMQVNRELGMESIEYYDYLGMKDFRTRLIAEKAYVPRDITNCWGLLGRKLATY